MLLKRTGELDIQPVIVFHEPKVYTIIYTVQTKSYIFFYLKYFFKNLQIIYTVYTFVSSLNETIMKHLTRENIVTAIIVIAMVAIWKWALWYPSRNSSTVYVWRGTWEATNDSSTQYISPVGSGKGCETVHLY